MRVFGDRKKSSPEAAVNHLHFVAWDFFKMLAAAVLCGLAVSVTVAGVTLLLSGSAEAHEQTGDGSEVRDATPGVLLVGSGCDGLELTAADRDWYVRIDGRTIDVRVMQTWIIPPEVEGAAVFQVRLPQGAQLKTLSVQSPRSEWAGRKIAADAFAKLPPARYLRLTRNQLLVAYSPDGDVTTSPLLGVRPGDAIIVQYTYSVISDLATHDELLLLPLDPPWDAKGLQPQLTDEDAILTPMQRPPAVRGSIWVEWTGSKPSQMLIMPREASIERDAKSAHAIAALSWSSDALKPGEQFRLAWLM